MWEIKAVKSSRDNRITELTRLQMLQQRARDNASSLAAEYKVFGYNITLGAELEPLLLMQLYSTVTLDSHGKIEEGYSRSVASLLLQMPAVAAADFLVMGSPQREVQALATLGLRNGFGVESASIDMAAAAAQLQLTVSLAVAEELNDRMKRKFQPSSSSSAQSSIEGSQDDESLNIIPSLIFSGPAMSALW